jgi:hypothetical protein
MFRKDKRKGRRSVTNPIAHLEDGLNKGAGESLELQSMSEGEKDEREGP